MFRIMRAPLTQSAGLQFEIERREAKGEAVLARGEAGRRKDGALIRGMSTGEATHDREGSKV